MDEGTQAQGEEVTSQFMQLKLELGTLALSTAKPCPVICAESLNV